MAAATWAQMAVSVGGTGSLTLADYDAVTPSFDDAFGAGSTSVSYIIVDRLVGRFERGTASFNGTTKVLSSRTVAESYTGGAYGTSAITVTTDAIVFCGPNASKLGEDGDYGAFTVSSDGTVATLNSDVVTTDAIAAEAVTAAKIPDGEIPVEKLVTADVLTTAELQTALGVPATDGRKVDLLFSFSAAANGTYVLDPKATFPYTINSLVIDSLDNTATAKVQIAGVDVTGLTGISVTTTISETNATAANSVVAGNEVTLVLSAISTTASLVGKLKVTRG